MAIISDALSGIAKYVLTPMRPARQDVDAYSQCWHSHLCSQLVRPASHHANERLPPMRPRLRSAWTLCCNEKRHQNYLHAPRRTHVRVFFESAVCRHNLLKEPEPQEYDRCWKTRQERWQWTVLLQGENVDRSEIFAKPSGTNEISMQWRVKKHNTWYW